MNVLVTKRNSSTIEVNRSSPNLNTKSNSEDNDVTFNEVGANNACQSISKSHQTIATIFSMQNSQEVSSNNADDGQVSGEPCLNTSFKQLSRRESSLENLTEDNTSLQNNASVSDNSVTYYAPKLDTEDDIKDFTRRNDSSSRFRRTMYSLFSCCSPRSRRSTFMIKIEEGNTESENEKCTNQMVDRQTGNKEQTSLNCLRLRKFFDILDESEVEGKRSQQVRQILPSVPYRDGDKTDSHSHKAGDNVQSENGGTNMARSVLLGPIKSVDHGKKCFIIDLDETLVHSSFKMVDKADFKVGVDIEGTVHTVYVLKRPYVDIFLQKMGRIFECVLFTASLAKYADPVTDFLDKWRIFRWRLFRESCVFHRGNYVKDLGILGRPTDQIAILDNSPASYMFHPDSAVQITSWFDDPKDTALLDLIPYLEQLAEAPSVPSFLAAVKPPPKATVPVSVMLPLPVGPQHTFIASPPPPPSPPPQSSSQPITSMSPPDADSDSSQVPIQSPPNQYLLPFSPSLLLSTPCTHSLAKSLSTLATVHYNPRYISRSEGSIANTCLSQSSGPIIIPPVIATLPRLSASVNCLWEPLNVTKKSRSTSTPIFTRYNTLIQSTSPKTLIQSTSPKTLIQSTSPKTLIQSTSPKTLIQSTSPKTLIQSTSPKTLIQSTSPKTLIQSTSPKTLIQSTSPKTLIHSTSPKTLIQSTSPNTLIQSTSPNILIQSTSPNTLIQSTSPKTLIQSMLPNTLIQSTSPNTLIQSRSPRIMIQSSPHEVCKSPDALIRSSSTSSPSPETLIQSWSSDKLIVRPNTSITTRSVSFSPPDNPDIDVRSPVRSSSFHCQYNPALNSDFAL